MWSRPILRGAEGGGAEGSRDIGQLDGGPRPCVQPMRGITIAAGRSNRATPEVVMMRSDKFMLGNAAWARRFRHHPRIVSGCTISLAALLASARPASAQRPSLDSLPPGSPVTIRPLYGDDQILRV